MHRNPYRRRPTSAADQYLEFEEYDDDDDALEGSMSELALYELNPPGRGSRQRAFGAGGGYADGGGWHAGGGRYLDPGYLPADYPDGTYHPGGGQVSRGYHGGGGYYSNPSHACARCGGHGCGCGCEGDPAFCTCRAFANPYGGSMLDDGRYQSPYNQNPPGRGSRQRAFGAGGGYADGGGWHAGGGRYLDPGYLPADYPDGTYHPGGGQVSRGYHGGGGYFSNPYGGSMLDDGGYQSPWDQNPYRYRLPKPPSDPRMVRAYNNPPGRHRCHHCGCHL